MQIKPENIVEINYNLPPIEYCLEYLNSKISIYNISPQYKDVLRSGLEMIKNCIESINKNDKPHEKFKYSDIEKGLNILTQIITEIKNEKYFDKFVYDYTFLAHNVNMNTLKNNVVKNKCEYLDRYVHKSLLFNETLMMFNSITNKLAQWKTFVPPSFKLSEHYFNIIKED
jgi:hypothetical protein